MKRALTAILVPVMLAGCVSFVDPVPAGYTGPLATIADSYTNDKGSPAHFFVLTKIGGQLVEDSGYRTRVCNLGRRFNMKPVMVSRDVPATEQTFTLTGLIQFANDGQGLFGYSMRVEGDVTFAPAAKETYTVRGELTKTRAAVWLEDSAGGLVGERIVEEKEAKK